MKLKKCYILICTTIAFTATGCSMSNPPSAMIKPPISVNSELDSNKDILNEVNKIIPKDARIINPENPEGSKGIQLKDIDGDGNGEAIVLYKLNGADGHAGFLVLKQDSNNKWNKIMDYRSDGSDVNYLNIANVTGNENGDIIIGWQMGSTANGLDLFTWKNKKLEKVASSYYSKIEVSEMADKNGNKNGKNDVALWVHDTGEAYIIDVLKWDGSRLVSDTDAYPYYFKTVVPYYEQKIKELPGAAFYWYYLADAQIKAGDSKNALNSINEGLALKKKSPNIYPEDSKFLELKKLALNSTITN